MPKHQLTISPDYVADWTYLQAVRELFQNALDNNTVNPENEMFFSFEEGVLSIGNKTSVLLPETLLLGASSKRDDKQTIGKHGEGYKVALMVLLREGKEVTIYNYGAKEIWKTRLVKSRKFNGALITEIDVQKQAIFKKVPSHNLIIEVKGISQEEYAHIIESNLHLHEAPIARYETSNSMGSILLEDKFAGNIYVNGLYITTNKKFTHGYDIMPEYISLDRDRKLVDTIDIAFITSKMWRKVGQEDKVAKMLLKEVLDVKYIEYHSHERYREASEGKEGVDKSISSSLKEAFEMEHGVGSVPVSTNQELQLLSTSAPSVKPVMVTTEVYTYLKDVIEQPEIITLTPKKALMKWMEEVRHKLSEEEVEDFNNILGSMPNK